MNMQKLVPPKEPGLPFWLCALALAAFLVFCATYAQAEALPPVTTCSSDLRDLQSKYNALEDKLRMTPQCRRYWTNVAELTEPPVAITLTPEQAVQMRQFIEEYRALIKDYNELLELAQKMQKRIEQQQAGGMCS